MAVALGLQVQLLFASPTCIAHVWMHQIGSNPLLSSMVEAVQTLGQEKHNVVVVVRLGDLQHVIGRPLA